MTDFFKEDIDQCEIEYYSGNSFMLFEAIRRCAQYSMLLPDWARWELERGMRKYTDAEVGEFGEAFGIAKQTHLRAKRKKHLYAWKVYERCIQLNKKGIGLDIPLWEEVAKEFPISPGQVKKYFYDVSQYLSDISKKL